MSTTNYAMVESRFAFTLPDLYKRMYEDRCFDEFSEVHLQFTDIQWLGVDSMFSYVFDPHLIDGLIPFAESLSGNLWAWYPRLDLRNPQAVVSIPEEDEVAVLYAPDFCSAMYRMILEELSNTFLVERGTEKTAVATLRRFCTTLANYFPQDWNQRLAEIVERPLLPTQENFHGMIGEEEVEHILTNDLAYDRLDEEFLCAKEEDASSSVNH